MHILLLWQNTTVVVSYGMCIMINCFGRTPLWWLDSEGAYVGSSLISVLRKLLLWQNTTVVVGCGRCVIINFFGRTPLWWLDSEGA